MSGAAVTKYDEMLKRLCCDLANDAAASENGLIPISTVQARLYNYSEEIAQALSYAGPTSLRQWQHRKGRKGNAP